MDMLGDTESIFGWYPLIRVSTKGTREIAANAKTLVWRTRGDAVITEQDHFLVNFTAVYNE